jgi:hypothetical protein
MPKITIYLYDDKCLLSHCCTHIAAVIEEEERQKRFVIEYGQDNTEKLQSPNEYSDSVVLYSNKDMDNFIKQYEQEFKDDNYNFCFKNCADAVNHTLDYFFPNSYAAQCWFTTKKLVCCLPGIAFLGGSCVPAPLLITTPKSVFSKAKSISNSREDKKDIELSLHSFNSPKKMAMQ